MARYNDFELDLRNVKINPELAGSVSSQWVCDSSGVSSPSTGCWGSDHTLYNCSSRNAVIGNNADYVTAC